MACTLFPASGRGHSKTNWLDSYHIFSFDQFFDPLRMDFGQLRVLNDDIIAANTGFPMHPHRDFEIVTIVLEGALEHQDSMGNKGIIQAGEIQRMSAGTGVVHSEANPGPDPVHLLQIWISPDKKGRTPSYEQKTAFDAKSQGLVNLIPKEMRIGQDASFTYGHLQKDQHIAYTAKNAVFAYVIDGSITIDRYTLQKGDGLGITKQSAIPIKSKTASEFVLIEVPE